MGLLDDAIREHLDLKRRRGGDPEEIERMERDALGPVRREPTSPGGQDAAFTDAPVHADDDERYADDDRYEPEYADDGDVEDTPATATAHDDPFAGEQYDDDFFDEQPTQLHRAEPEEEHEPRRFGLFGRKSQKHERHEDADGERFDDDERSEPAARDRDAAPEPTAFHDFDEPQSDAWNAPVDDDDPFTDDRHPDDDPFTDADAGVAKPQPEPVPPPPRRPRFTEQARTPAPSAEPDDDRDDAELRAPDTAERGPGREETWDDKTQLFEFDDDEPEAEPAPEEQSDVLEGTPDFLQDTPDHDRLWFEQKPPRDFDFGN